MDYTDLVTKLLSAVAQDNRIKIIQFLKDGEKCVCEIYPALALEQSNLSKHLKILSDAGILEARKNGISVFYRVKDRRIFKIIEFAEKIVYDDIKKLSGLISAEK